MGIAERFHTSIQICPLTSNKSIYDCEADLDTCAELDIVSYALARKLRLQQCRLTYPIIRAIGELQTPTFGVYSVPIRATDSRGTTRSFNRPCVAINRDLSPKNSPVLLSMTTMQQHQIRLDAPTRRWWYQSQDMKLLNGHKFAKVCRNHAYVFAVVKMPEEIWLPGDPNVLQTGNTQTLPVEFEPFRDVFSKEGARTLPSSKQAQHAIKIIDGESPPWGPIYPLSEAELATLRKYIQENIEYGRIRPSSSPAGAPILFVPKKDGTLRLCVDYRGLNKVTVKNRYPLPLISEILDRLSGAKYFSKLDLKDAYYRIQIQPGDEWKTAWRCRYGHFEYTVMPFGLTNAPATFQNYIHTALYDILDRFCIVYLDDILIFSQDAKSHQYHVQQVLKRLQKAELYANLSKCTFYQPQVEFLGYIISQDGVEMDPERIRNIADWPEPITFRELQVFLGFCNFYRRFIHNYSRIALPLTGLLKGSHNGRKPGDLHMNDHETTAFRQLKLAFQSAPLLTHFNPSQPIRLETDASKYGMAGILSQPDPNGKYHPVAFWSYKFKDAEINYSTPDQELFAIVHSFKHWRQYLEGSHHTVEVLSDHQNLQGFMKQPRMNGRQARWCLYLTPFNFIIKHRAGKTNPADGPSRIYEGPNDQTPKDELLAPIQQRIVNISCLTVSDLYACKTQFELDETSEQESPGLSTHIVQSTLIGAGAESADWAVWNDLKANQTFQNILIQETTVQEDVYSNTASKSLMNLITDAQRNDPETQNYIQNLQTGETKSNNWTIDHKQLLYFKNRLFIPPNQALRNKILSLYHDDPLSGHFGRNRTESLMKRKFHWTGMQTFIYEYIQNCPTCQGTIAQTHRPYGKLEAFPMPNHPFEELSVDFITGLPVTENNNQPVDAIFVVVDRLTKWCIFLPVSTTITAPQLAELYHREIELRYGPAKGITSDRGSLFTSNYWSKMAYFHHTKLRLSTAFRPQTDGQTERINQVIERYLRCFIDENQLNWPKLLPSAQFACNNAINLTIKTSPFEALHGYQPDFFCRIEDDPSREEVPAATERASKLNQLRERLQEHWQKSNKNYEENYNKRHKSMNFKAKSLVKLSTKHLNLKVPSRKLAPRFIGPFRILSAIGSQAYRLALPNKYNQIHNVFHVSLLEPWNGESKDPLTMPDLDDSDEWEVDEIQDKKQRDDEVFYLVKWKGWPTEYNQWVSEDHLNAPRLVTLFDKRLAKGRRHNITS